MIKTVYAFLAVVTAIAFIQSARGDDTKPLDSPIHMTYLPVPDEFRSAPVTPEMARATQDSRAESIVSAMPVLAQSEVSRDDTDADLAHGGRRSH